MKKNKDKSITIRLESDLYQKCINKALFKGTKENKITRQLALLESK